MPESEITNVDEAAEYLGISRRAVIYAIERGDLTGRKLNPEKETSGWVLSWSDVKAYKKSKGKTGPLKAEAK